MIACVGGGSNAIGTFYAFLDDEGVELIGVEAGGEGLDGRHGASLVAGRTGVLHGALSSVLADEQGQILEAHSVSAGLDYPGVGPEHAQLRDTRSGALRGGHRCRGAARLPGAGSAGGDPARARARPRDRLAASSRPNPPLALRIRPSGYDLVCLSGRGDKDLAEVIARLDELDG